MEPTDGEITLEEDEAYIAMLEAEERDPAELIEEIEYRLEELRDELETAREAGRPVEELEAQIEELEERLEHAEMMLTTNGNNMDDRADR